MMDSRTFTSGRYKNLTFKYVYDTDKKFCKDVLKSDHTSTDDDARHFKMYLREKKTNSNPVCLVDSMAALTIFVKPPVDEYGVIKSIYCKDFIQSFNEMHSKQFNQLLKFQKIEVKSVHEASIKPKTHTVLGFFYRFFIKRLLFNQIPFVECYSNSLSELLTIFPVKLEFNNRCNNKRDLRILSYLITDKVLLRELKSYLVSQCKFDVKDEDVINDIKHMLNSIDQANDVDDFETKSLLDAKFFNNSRSVYIDILKRYLSFYEICKQSYLECLTYRNRPYLFDIVPSNLLSIRLKYLHDYRKYATYKENVSDLKDIIFRLAIFIISHKFSNALHGCVFDDIDDSVLQNLKHYVENITSKQSTSNCSHDTTIISPGISLIDYIKPEKNYKDLMSLSTVDKLINTFEVDRCFLKLHLIYYSNGKLFDMYYSIKSRTKMYHFRRLIMTASLMKLPCRELIIYNPRLGEESKIMMNNIDKETVKQFIRKYRHPNVWKEVPFLGHLL